VANLIAALTIPLWGALTDRIGRKPVFLAGNVGCVVFAALFLWRSRRATTRWSLRWA